MTCVEKDRIDNYAGQMEECISYGDEDETEFCGYNHKQCENILRKFADEIRRECAEELSKVKEKLCGIELNLCNYNDDDVRELQNNMLEGIAMLDAILGKKEP